MPNSKEDCKYWDKCYQRNELHLQKYNHPPKPKNAGNSEKMSAEGVSNSTKEVKDNKIDEATKQNAPKRKPSSEEKEKAPMSTNANGQDAETAPFETDDLRKEAISNISGKNYMEILQKRIKLSIRSEYDALLRSNEFIRHKFLVEMPPDFYAFWKFVCSLVKTEKDEGDAGSSACSDSSEAENKKGEAALQHMEKQFQLQLVGPFEFLAGRFHNATMREPGDYLRHWRFFYDPPEFQTVFVKRGTGVHYGYWRDTPQDKESLLVARNDSKAGCEHDFVAGNLFDAFLHYLEKDFRASPFTAATVNSTKKAQQAFIELNEVRLEKLETLRKSRNKDVVAKTFHKAGIVVPVEAKTRVGYRPLIVSDSELRSILNLFEKAGAGDGVDDTVKRAVMEKLQPVATAASIALDESDFGTSLELGVDLFCSGRYELHMLIQSLLVPAYSLLHRPQFIAISKAHLEKRSKELNLSIFELDKKQSHKENEK